MVKQIPRFAHCVVKQIPRFAPCVVKQIPRFAHYVVKQIPRFAHCVRSLGMTALRTEEKKNNEGRLKAVS